MTCWRGEDVPQMATTSVDVVARAAAADPDARLSSSSACSWIEIRSAPTSTRRGDAVASASEWRAWSLGCRRCGFRVHVHVDADTRTTATTTRTQTKTLVPNLSFRIALSSTTTTAATTRAQIKQQQQQSFISTTQASTAWASLSVRLFGSLQTCFAQERPSTLRFSREKRLRTCLLLPCLLSRRELFVFAYLPTPGSQLLCVFLSHGVHFHARRSLYPGAPLGVVPDLSSLRLLLNYFR